MAHRNRYFEGTNNGQMTSHGYANFNSYVKPHAGYLELTTLILNLPEFVMTCITARVGTSHNHFDHKFIR
jgi:hypothetical protein